MRVFLKCRPEIDQTSAFEMNVLSNSCGIYGNVNIGSVIGIRVGRYYKKGTVKVFITIIDHDITCKSQKHL